MGDFLRHDLKAALRTLKRDRSFSLIAISTLSLGLAGTSIIFSLVNGILLKPLAFRDAGRLVSISEIVPEVSKLYPLLPVNARHFDLWRKQATSFAAMALVRPREQILSRAGEPQKIAVARVSANFFPTLGIQPQFGRNFLEEEDRPGGGDVAIITYPLWSQRFNRDPGIAGKSIYLDGSPCTVIGVLPASFRPPTTDGGNLVSVASDTRVFRPAAIDLNDIGMVGEFNDAVIARLKPGITRTEALSELNVIQEGIAKQLPEAMHLRAAITPLAEEMTGRVRTGLIILLASIGAVLLIVCVNLANLSLARAVARNRDMSIRTALGASRWRMIRQMLTESVAISLTGGALGLALAWAGLRLLLSYAPLDLPRLDEIALDGRVLLFGFGISVLAGVVFGLLPAWQVSKADPQTALRAGSHTVTEARQGVRVRDALVSLEVGLGAVLVITAGLLVLSFVRLLKVDLGFSPENLIAADISLPQASYKEKKDRELLYRGLAGKLEELPGVKSAALVSKLPLTGETWISMVIREGDKRPIFQQPAANYRFITPDYFKTMGIPLVAGRVFNEGDRKRNLAVVSEKVARKVWPGENPIGRRFSAGNENEPLFEIAGVVKDVRAGIASDPVMMVYTPYWYRNQSAMTAVLRTAMDPKALAPAVRSAVWALNPEAAIENVRTMDRVVTDSVAQRRFQMYLIAGFAGFALLLATLGIYGVVSWSVARRRNEIGVRMALGARPADVHRIVVAQAIRPAAVGLVIGIALALAFGRILNSLLFGVSARDPLVFAGVAALLIAVSLVACYVPARKATRMDPLNALRYE